VWDNPPVFGLILLSIVPFLFGMPINTLLPAFNEDILGGGAEDLGLLMSAMGLGAIVGSLLLASANDFKNRAAWLIATCAGWGVFTSAFGFSQTMVLSASMIAVIGFLSSWNMSLNRGLLQLQVDDHMRGKIMSVDMMSHGLMPIGVIPISIIAEQYNVAIAIVISGVAFVVLVGLLAFFAQSVRHVDDNLQPMSGG
jgi:MFS family permease